MPTRPITITELMRSVRLRYKDYCVLEFVDLVNPVSDPDNADILVRLLRNHNPKDFFTLLAVSLDYIQLFTDQGGRWLGTRPANLLLHPLIFEIKSGGKWRIGALVMPWDMDTVKLKEVCHI